MPPPPLKRLGLRPAGRGIFPCLLPAQHGPVEQGEVRIHGLDPAIRGEVGVIHRVAVVAQEAAQAKGLALIKIR